MEYRIDISIEFNSRSSSERDQKMSMSNQESSSPQSFEDALIGYRVKINDPESWSRKVDEIRNRRPEGGGMTPREKFERTRSIAEKYSKMHKRQASMSP